MNLRATCTVATLVLPVTVQWTFNQTVVTSMDYSTGSTHQLELSIDNVNLTNGGVYTCRANYENGTESDDTSVTIFGKERRKRERGERERAMHIDSGGMVILYMYMYI